MNKKVLDWILVIWVVATICIMIWMVNFLKTNSLECNENPVKYFEEKNNASCWCLKDNLPIDFGEDTTLEGNIILNT